MSVKCSNCENDAAYTLGDQVHVVNYCDNCLPAHFVADAARGEYPLLEKAAVSSKK